MAIGNRRSAIRNAFTLVELLCGISVTAVVMTAMAGVVLAVSSNWRENDPARASQQHADTAVRRLTTLIQPMRLVGQVTPGSLQNTGTEAAAMLFWASDANEDGQIQLSELVLIEHNRSDRTLQVYQMRLPTGLTESEREAVDLTVSYGSISDQTSPAVFRTMAYVTARPLMRNVAGARFVQTGATPQRRPSIEFALRLEQGGAEAIAYGAALLRAAGKEPTS